MSQQKPSLNFWQIWNMCFGFLGIQFGFALQNANVSRIFQTLGASIDDIPILWIAAPLTGLIVQPIIGYLSDKTWNHLGRRRPYFLYGAIVTSLAIIVMPNSSVLWIAAGTLWIMDASINITMEPFRAFVGDMLPKKQHATGYAFQSFFIGIGAIVASALPWILTNWLDVSNVAPQGEISDSVTYSFYAGAVVLLAAVSWTVYRTKEYSPEQLAAFEKASTDSKLAYQEKHRSAKQYLTGAAIWSLAGLVLLMFIYTNSLDKELYLVAGGLIAFGLVEFITAFMIKRSAVNNGFYQVVNDLFHMPKAMQQLAVTQFFSWFALFAMWIYTTSAVTSFHYGTSDATSKLFNDGADWVGVLFASYNGFAALAAVFIPWIVSKVGLRMSHLFNLTCGALGLISFSFITNPDHLIYSMVGVGIAWASILSLPYALLSNSLPAHKMGVYMGIFNFFIVIPQLLAASILGVLVRYAFDGQTIYALVLGGVSLIIAGISTLFVSDANIQTTPSK
jgi:maltose/moltooligosaccharide transporter